MMKNFAKSIIAALVCALTFGFVSCSDNSDNKIIFGGYYSVVGSNPNYKFVSDDGAVFYATVNSINTLTQNKGFGDHKRVYLYMSYYPENVSKVGDQITVRDVELISGNYILEKNVMTKEEATAANLNVPDSVFAVTTLGRCWAANGFFNTYILAPVSGDAKGNVLSPTSNLQLNSVDENALSFTLLYNRHSKKTASSLGNVEIVNAFDITELEVPGKDSVNVRFEVEGANPLSIKIPRSAFNYAK